MKVESGKLVQQLSKRLRKYDGADARVVYAAPYAVYVHEDLTKHHSNGQAKFLSQPAQLLRKEIAEAFRDVLKAGGKPKAAAVAACEVLLKASRELVPVATGVLRDSGGVE